MAQTCPSCNADIADDAAFCSECGARTPASVAGASAKPRFCIQCGAELREDATFCGECGSPAAQPDAVPSVMDQPQAPPTDAVAEPSYAPTPPDSAPPVAVAAPPYQAPVAVAAPPYQAPAPAPARRAARIPFLGWLAFAGMVTAIFLPWLPEQEGYMNWIDMIRRGWQAAAIPWVAYAPFIVPAWSLMACLIRGWPGAVARVLGGFAALGFCVYLIAVSSEEIGVELLRVLGAGFWVFLGAGLVMLISGSYEGKRPA